MQSTSRRRFLKHTSLGLGAIAALPRSLKAAEAAAIPAHEPMAVPGVHAYANAESVAAGGTIRFHISNSVPCEMSVCRLGETVDDPAGDEVLQVFPEIAPNPQAIHPGSYIFIPRGLRGVFKEFTAECWVRPWKLSRTGAILTQFDDSQCAVGLFLAPDGALTFRMGETEGSTPAKTCAPSRWHHVAATWNGKEMAVWVDARKIAGWPLAGPLPAWDGGALRIGAAAKGGISTSFLDADVAAPALYDFALTAEGIQRRHADKGLHPPRGAGLLACWPLAEEKGARVRDISGKGRHGRIINGGTWMIGGPGFDAAVTRFGDYQPERDPQRGHALRLAADDLYDCRWASTHSYRVPPQARQGLYVARFHYEQEGKPRLYHVTFVVKKPARRRKAPILVLCATNTWRAYSGTPFPQNPAQLMQVWGTGGIQNGPGEPPAFNFYRGHASGPGTYQMGLRMPWPAASPYVLYGGPTGYSHLARADRFAHLWLEQAGYAFDVVTDLDLHRNPEMLKGYEAFIINAHSEYWSIEMYEGLERYLRGGGNLISLSGNSLFWRVSYNEDGSIIECRKVDAPGEQVPAAQRGESWHSHDGKRGGMLRECGYPGWKLTGLETLGWCDQGVDAQFGPYHVDEPEHFLFNHPEKCGFQKGDAFGQAPGGKLPRANGHEIDIRLSTLAALQEKPSPQGAMVPLDPPGITRLANGVITWKIGGAAFDYFFQPIKPKTDQGGEVIYWEREEGGKVFNAGSIGSGWALAYDEKFQTLMRNVLFHFGVKPGKG